MIKELIKNIESNSILKQSSISMDIKTEYLPHLRQCLDFMGIIQKDFDALDFIKMFKTRDLVLVKSQHKDHYSLSDTNKEVPSVFRIIVCFDEDSIWARGLTTSSPNKTCNIYMKVCLVGDPKNINDPLMIDSINIQLRNIFLDTSFLELFIHEFRHVRDSSIHKESLYEMMEYNIDESEMVSKLVLLFLGEAKDISLNDVELGILCDDDTKIIPKTKMKNFLDYMIFLNDNVDLCKKFFLNLFSNAIKKNSKTKQSILNNTNSIEYQALDTLIEYCIKHSMFNLTNDNIDIDIYDTINDKTKSAKILNFSNILGLFEIISNLLCKWRNEEVLAYKYEFLLDLYHCSPFVDNFDDFLDVSSKSFLGLFDKKNLEKNSLESVYIATLINNFRRTFVDENTIDNLFKSKELCKNELLVSNYDKIKKFFDQSLVRSVISKDVEIIKIFTLLENKASLIIQNIYQRSFGYKLATIDASIFFEAFHTKDIDAKSSRFVSTLMFFSKTNNEIISTIKNAQTILVQIDILSDAPPSESNQYCINLLLDRLTNINTILSKNMGMRNNFVSFLKDIASNHIEATSSEQEFLDDILNLDILSKAYPKKVDAIQEAICELIRYYDAYQDPYVLDIIISRFERLNNAIQSKIKSFSAI